MSRPVKTDLETHPQHIQTMSESHVKTNANNFTKNMHVQIKFYFVFTFQAL